MKGKSLGGMGRSCRFFFSGGMLGNVMHFGCWGEGYADLVFFQEAEVVTRNNSWCLTLYPVPVAPKALTQSPPVSLWQPFESLSQFQLTWESEV